MSSGSVKAVKTFAIGASNSRVISMVGRPSGATMTVLSVEGIGFFLSVLDSDGSVVGGGVGRRVGGERGIGRLLAREERVDAGELVLGVPAERVQPVDERA